MEKGDQKPSRRPEKRVRMAAGVGRYSTEVTVDQSASEANRIRWARRNLKVGQAVFGLPGEPVALLILR